MLSIRIPAFSQDTSRKVFQKELVFFMSFMLKALGDRLPPRAALKK